MSVPPVTKVSHQSPGAFRGRQASIGTTKGKL